MASAAISFRYTVRSPTDGLAKLNGNPARLQMVQRSSPLSDSNHLNRTLTLLAAPQYPGLSASRLLMKILSFIIVITYLFAGPLLAGAEENVTKSAQGFYDGYMKV